MESLMVWSTTLRTMARSTAFTPACVAAVLSDTSVRRSTQILLNASKRSSTTPVRLAAPSKTTLTPVSLASSASTRNSHLERRDSRSAATTRRLCSTWASAWNNVAEILLTCSERFLRNSLWRSILRAWL